MADGPVTDERWKRIKALFASAIEQPPDTVGAWLDAHCGGDADLARELESLIASHRSADGFMETPAIAEPGAATAVADRVIPSIQSAMIQRRLGPYRLVAELGRGGMGVVYLAERDDEAFSRQVAIKVVHAGVLHPSLVDRFEAERRILARLEHTNIARLLDAGTDESGTPFAVMEHVEGTPIDVYVRDHRLSIAQRLALFCAVCDAVQYSHERLVVHRDIKPGNVLVTGDGVPKLLDFGIAKLLDPSGAAPERTRTDLRALTPESASPEQVRGDPITVASDVYSLGVLLFRLLTDTSPYQGRARTDAEMARAICEEDAPRPSDAAADAGAGLSPREISVRRRELKGDLDLITIKALRKEPQRRYASVERLARDITRHLGGEPVEAAPDSQRYRAGKFLRRHRAGVALAAAIAVTTAAGLVATLLQARVARIERERAERRFDDVRELARSMIFEVHDAIEPLPGSTAARELLIRRALGYLDRLASEPGADASLQRELASAYARIGDVQGAGGLANLGQQKAALESYRKALAIRERLAAAALWDRAAQADLARVQRYVGALLAAIGDSRGALEHLRAAVSVDERLLAGQPGDPALESELARSYVGLSDGLVSLEDWQPALSLLQQALPLFQRAADAAPEEVRAQRALALTYKRIGGIQVELGDYTHGLEANRSALAIDERRLDSEPDSPEARMDVSLDLSDIGLILLRLGDERAALAQFERVRAIREDVVHADPSDTRARRLLANAISQVALARWQLGEREPALAAHRAALVHLEALAAVMPADVYVQQDLADEMAALGLGYAQTDAGRPNAAGCRRARPVLVQALDAYRDLQARGRLSAEAANRVSELEAAAARCGSGR